MIFAKNPKVLTRLQRYKAFTLAEVLITLGIIGVVAAMTIPTLINNYQNTQYVTQLKKAYSTIQQGFKEYLADEGTESLGDTELFDGSTGFYSQERFDKIDAMTKKYFNVLRSRKSISDWSYSGNGTYLNYPSMGVLNIYGNSDYVFQTLDGMNIAIFLQASCQPNYSKTSNMKANCGQVTVDVNGFKPPNIMGRDIFFYFVLGHDGSLYPLYGKQYVNYNWGTNEGFYWRNYPSWCGTANSTTFSDTTNGYCIARIIEEGWKMTY